MENLSNWLAQVSNCSARKEVFGVLDEFRKHSWSDEECSQMARHYIRIVSKMADDSIAYDTKQAPAGEGNEADGPVWYEKM